MVDKALRIIKSLNEEKVDYIIIGGYAVILHGFLRATEDIDIVLKLTKENILYFQRAIKKIYDEDIDEITFSELQKYSVIRYGTPENFYIDIISGIGKTFSFENIIPVEKIVEGVKIKFASAESLFAMKKNTYREKDKLDLLFLKEKLKHNDI